MKTTSWPGSTPTGRTRTFSVTVSKTVEITVDESVIAQGVLPDNPIFGANVTEDDVVQYLAFNLVVNHLRLSQIDGFANCDDASVSFPYENWDVEVDREIVPPPATRSPRRRK